MNDYIIKTLVIHNMMFDIRGRIRSNKALYVYIFSSNNSSVKPLISLFASLSFLSLVLLLSFSFFHPPPPPLNQPYIHLMPLYLFSLSCSSPLSLFFTSSPLHRPYIHPMNLYLFSLPRSSSPSIFNLNLRSYGQLFVLVFIYKP